MAAKKTSRLKGNSLVGDVVHIPRDSVRPNPWNPNVVAPEMLEALRFDLETNGWLVSQAMTVWNTDERGRKQGLILDGEHRWTLAAGMKKVPAVLLDGLTEAQAKALTLKLAQRRGHFDVDQLADIVRSLQRSSEVSSELALHLGYSDDYIAELTRPAAPPASMAPPPAASTNSNVKMVPLFFSAEQHAEFDALVVSLGKRWKIDNVTDTVARAVQESL